MSTIKNILQKHGMAILAMGLLLLVIWLLFRRCGNSAGPDTVTVIHDTIPGDPYPVEIPRYVPVVRREQRFDTLLREILTPADTAAIVRDYLTVRYYSDTLKNDTSMLAVVADSVAGNRIVSRKFTYQNRRPTAINTTIIQPPRQEALVQVYAGVFAGYSAKKQQLLLGPELSVALRPGPIFRYGYDIAGNSHLVGVGWKISFTRKTKPSQKIL